MSIRSSHLAFRVVVVLLALTAAGCASRMSRVEIEADPALGAIREAFDEVVATAHADTELAWYSGILGNLIVNYRGNEHMGLCYHWQEWVYQEVLPAVEAVGWEATGITINLQTSNEHHAVVVWDPAVARREDLIEHAETTPSYVLDARRRGRPDIYRMSEWLKLPMRVRVAPALEDLPYQEYEVPLPFLRD